MVILAVQRKLARFNSIKGTIKTDVQRALKRKLDSFNSIKGTIKTIALLEGLVGYDCFNSIKGTIKTTQARNHRAPVRQFQFHKRYD